MNTKEQAFAPPSMQENLAAWQQHLQDISIDPTIDAFGQAVADKLNAFCAKTPLGKIAYHSHMHMEKGVAICYKIGGAHYLWMSVFPENESHKDWRATVNLARQSLRAKGEGCSICKTTDEAALAIIGEIKRICKISAP